MSEPLYLEVYPLPASAADTPQLTKYRKLAHQLFELIERVHELANVPFPEDREAIARRVASVGQDLVATAAGEVAVVHAARTRAESGRPSLRAAA